MNRGTLDIRSFDPRAATRGEWGAVHAFRHASDAEDIPGEPSPADEDFERMARRHWPLHERRHWYAWRDGAIVGNLGVSFRREGTADYDGHAPYVDVWLVVRRHGRRQRVASDLLRPLPGFMRERNKTVATAITSTPEGDAFLQVIGARPKHRSIESRMVLADVDRNLLNRWFEAAIPGASRLRWEVHADRVPIRELADLLPHLNTLSDDVPLGEMDAPPLRAELPAWLAAYEELDLHGGDHMMVMLRDGDAVAAVCETIWDARYPDRVYQNLTAVARAWRGRGLAKGVKAAMLRLIRDRHPNARFVATWNANVNAAVLSINERLGFQPHRQSTVYQVGPDDLSAYLVRRPRSGG